MVPKVPCKAQLMPPALALDIAAQGPDPSIRPDLKLAWCLQSCFAGQQTSCRNLRGAYCFEQTVEDFWKATVEFAFFLHLGCLCRGSCTGIRLARLPVLLLLGKCNPPASLTEKPLNLCSALAQNSSVKCSLLKDPRRKVMPAE